MGSPGFYAVIVVVVGIIASFFIVVIIFGLCVLSNGVHCGLL